MPELLSSKLQGQEDKQQGRKRAMIHQLKPFQHEKEVQEGWEEKFKRPLFLVTPEIRKCLRGVSGETPSRNISEEELLYITCLQDRILNLYEKKINAFNRSNS